MVYLVLLIAVCFEVFGDSCMKLSNGFQKKLPIIGVVIGYATAFYLMSQTMEHLPLGFVYAVWTGLGIALTAVVGSVFWKEKFTLKKGISLVMIIAGVVILKLGV